MGPAHELGEIRWTETFRPTPNTLTHLHDFLIEGQRRGIIGLITDSSLEEFQFDPEQNKGVWVRLQFNIDTWKYEKVGRKKQERSFQERERRV